MKRITYVTLLLLLPVFLWAQTSDHYFYMDGEKRNLELNTKYISVSATQEASFQKIGTVKSLKVDKISRSNKALVNKGDVYSSEITLKENLSPADYMNKIALLKKNDKNIIVSPYFVSAAGKKLGISEKFLVQLHSEEDVAILEEMAIQNNVEIVEQDKYMPLWYFLRVTPQTGKTSLEMANLFYESGKFAVAEPEFLYEMTENKFKGKKVFEPEMTTKSSVSSTMNDPLLERQWGLDAIKTREAWDSYPYLYGYDYDNPIPANRSQGQGVVVAVIGDGVYPYHPDLQANIHSHTIIDENPRYWSRAYAGTMVAGIIGAVGGNGIGIVGIAPKCKIMNIEYDLELSQGSVTYPARSINHAVQNRADVIMNVWCHRYNDNIESAYLNDAIKYALMFGRDRLGCVVVFPHPESFSDGVHSPAKVPGVITVGHINQDFSLPRWRCGPDISAPGGPILSTTVMESSGYGYFDLGTTGSAAYVAGVAALMIGTNQRISAYEVKKIMEKSAQKVSSDFYGTIKPHGTWSHSTGYGLVDALLSRARSVPDRIAGIKILTDYVCEGDHVSFRIDDNKWIWNNPDAIEWYNGNNFFFVESSRNGIAKYYAMSMGPDAMSYVTARVSTNPDMIYRSDPVRIHAPFADDIAGISYTNFVGGRIYRCYVNNPSDDAIGYEWGISGDATIIYSDFDDKKRKTMVDLKMNDITTATSSFTLSLTTVGRCGDITISQTGRIGRGATLTQGNFDGTVRVYSASGTMVYSGTSDGDFDINSTNLSEGIYILETTDTEGNAVREKVMLKR